MIRKNMAVLLAFLCLTLWDGTAFPANAAESETVFSVRPESKPVVNPHKGWVQYVYDPGRFTDPVYGVENNPAWELTGTVYSRFFWSDIETEKGEYDWSAIDELAELCDKYGKTFAFGVIPADSGVSRPEGLVPEYVYDDGCKYVTAVTDSFYSDKGEQRTPVWSDEIYHKAAIALAAAIAERYDGDDRIEFIDIRSLGNWGEWHTYGLEGSEMPSEDIQKEYIKEWTELFDDTLLVLPVNDDKPTAVSEYAVSLGVTLRRDGLVGLEGHEKALSPAYEGGLPAVGETCYGYGYMRDNGTWSDDKLKTAVRGGRVTYMALAGEVTDGKDMYDQCRETVEGLANEIGYNFVVTFASVKYEGRRARITMKVKNTGLAPQYFPMTVMFAVTERDGSAPRRLPVKFFCESGSLAPGKTRTFSCEVSAEYLTPGKFLAAGIFEDTEDDLPGIRFACRNTADNNYLILGKI